MLGAFKNDHQNSYEIWSKKKTHGLWVSKGSQCVAEDNLMR